MRRERLAYAVPRAALRAFPVAAIFAVLVAAGLQLPASVALGVFLLIQLGWPLIVIGRSFDPVPEIETLREGAEAERRTASAINRLRRYGYVIMHDRRISGSEAHVGHLLVGPGGVMVIQSDASTGTVRYSKDGAKVDGQSLKKPLDLTKWIGDEVRARTRIATPMIKVPVTPILAMVEAGVLWSDGAVEGVTLISVKDLVSYIRGRPDRLNPAEVTKVVAAIQRLFPTYSVTMPAEAVTIDRDRWLTLVDTVRTIREQDGDATNLLDRLETIENDLVRLAAPDGQPEIQTARGDDSDDLINELTGMTGASSAPPSADDSPAGRRRGWMPAAGRPPRLIPRQVRYDAGDRASATDASSGDTPADDPGQGPRDPDAPFSS
jgi:hypothetical protein